MLRWKLSQCMTVDLRWKQPVSDVGKYESLQEPQEAMTC